MSTPTSDSPSFSVNDLIEHIEVYGVDVFPPVDPDKETIRAQAFFADLRDQWPHIYQKLTVGGNEFGITASFQLGVGRNIELPTFGLNPRGPIFTFPKLMGVPIDLRGINATEVFEQCLDLFLQTFPSPPGRQVLRVGLVRRLLFGTGTADCTPWLGAHVLHFDAAKLAGAQTVLTYKEAEYNIRISMQTVLVKEQTAVPVTGQLVSTQSQHGLAVQLDVNNRDVHELTPEERHAILTRANEVWPAGLLGFLNERRLP